MGSRKMGFGCPTSICGSSQAICGVTSAIPEGLVWSLGLVTAVSGT